MHEQIDVFFKHGTAQFLSIYIITALRMRLTTGSVSSPQTHITVKVNGRRRGVLLHLFVRPSAVFINAVCDPGASRQPGVKGQSRACLGFLPDPSGCERWRALICRKLGAFGEGGPVQPSTRLISPLGLGSRQK